MVIGRARPLQGCNHIARHRERALRRLISKSRLSQSLRWMEQEPDPRGRLVSENLHFEAGEIR
jgi:hypothetical protein